MNDDDMNKAVADGNLDEIKKLKEENIQWLRDNGCPQ